MNLRRIGGWLMATLAAVFLLPAAASADSATIRFLDAGGNDDPAVELGRTITITGSATAKRYLYAKWRNAGGPACSPSPGTDPGSSRYLPSTTGFGSPSYGPGGFSWSQTSIFDAAPGTYTFCIWLVPTPTLSNTGTPIQQEVTFRPPRVTLSGSVSPAILQPGQASDVNVNVVTEISSRIYARVNPSASPCAPTAAVDSGSYVNDLNGLSVSGAQTASARMVAPSQAGQYVLCLWLADSSTKTPARGLQQIPFSVIAPAVTRIAWRPSTVIKVRRPLVVTGRVVSTGRAVGTCHLQRYVSRRWTSVARRVVAVNGTCRMTVKFGRVGREQIRIRFVSASPKRFTSSGTAYRVVRVVR